MRSFRRREIFPQHVRFMTEDAVRWQPPDEALRIPDLAFRKLKFDGDPGAAGGREGTAPAGARAGPLRDRSAPCGRVSPDPARRAPPEGRFPGVAAVRAVRARHAARRAGRTRGVRSRRRGDAILHGPQERHAVRHERRLHVDRRSAGCRSATRSTSASTATAVRLVSTRRFKALLRASGRNRAAAICFDRRCSGACTGWNRLEVRDKAGSPPGRGRGQGRTLPFKIERSYAPASVDRL